MYRELGIKKQEKTTKKLFLIYAEIMISEKQFSDDV